MSLSKVSLPYFSSIVSKKALANFALMGMPPEMAYVIDSHATLLKLKDLRSYINEKKAMFSDIDPVLDFKFNFGDVEILIGPFTLMLRPSQHSNYIDLYADSFVPELSAVNKEILKHERKIRDVLDTYDFYCNAGRACINDHYADVFNEPCSIESNMRLLKGLYAPLLEMPLDASFSITLSECDDEMQQLIQRNIDKAYYIDTNSSPSMLLYR